MAPGELSRLFLMLAVRAPVATTSGMGRTTLAPAVVRAGLAGQWWIREFVSPFTATNHALKPKEHRMWVRNRDGLAETFWTHFLPWLIVIVVWNTKIVDYRKKTGWLVMRRKREEYKRSFLRGYYTQRGWENCQKLLLEPQKEKGKGKEGEGKV